MPNSQTKLKTVEEVMEQLKNWGWSTDGGKEAFTHEQFKQIQITISLNRQDIERVLVEGLEQSKKRCGHLVEANYRETIDQAITLVKEVLQGK